MDTFVDSSWYFLRYSDPHNDAAPYDREIADYWGPVDFYQGGVDHATVHMIYARFYMKALNDIDLIGFREPFIRFHGNGWVQLGGTKMSKSKGNVLGPDQFVAEYGADPTRLYSCSSPRPTRTWSSPRRAWRAWCASSAGCGASCKRPSRRSRGAGEPGRADAARPTRRSRRSPTTSAGARRSTRRSRR